MFGKKQPPQIELGDKARDVVTGYQGVVVHITRWLNGCVRVGIQSEKLKDDGSVLPSEVFDIEQLERIGIGVRLQREPSGGDRPNAVRPADPQR